MLTRRAFLASLMSFLATVWTGAGLPGDARAGRPKAAGKGQEDRLDEFARHIVSGGPPKDGIPPIDHPKAIPATEADKILKDADIVFGVDDKGVVKAYPQMILVWHEIVNETIGGEKVSITYCPLTGSAVGFKGRSKVDGSELTFGTSGKLVNSNLLMYDRQTESHWPQILGVAIDGPNKGNVLEEFPVVWTTWGRWKRRHPQTSVLSTETGFFRAYGRDPYGSYARRGTYYDSGGPFFPVMATNNRFMAKQVVIGVKLNGFSLAIPKDAMQAKKVGQTILGGVPIVILYDEDLDTVRVYSRQIGGRTLSFWLKNGKIVDIETGSEWDLTGRSTGGRLKGLQLTSISAYDVMWFAWYAFYPETKVYVSTGR